MEPVSSVHYGTDFDNAFWNGSQMVYGDGSGQFLAVGALTKDLAVIGHEMTHGVVQFTAGLRYSKQSGALNESFSDVMGGMVKQWVRKQTADQADWLIGEGVLGQPGGTAMKVSVVKGGGLVPVVVTTTVDSERLAKRDAEKLHAMVDESGLFDLSPSGEPSPDAASYEFIVEDERRSCRVVLNDGELPPAVRSLLSWIGSVPGHEEQVGPL